MIDVIINLPQGESYGLSTITKGSVQEVVEAAKLLYPNWTSLVLTLVNQKGKSNG